LRGFFYAHHFAFAIFAHQIPTMKKIYFLLCGLFCFVAANAQVINFPDANFKAKLLAASVSNSIATNLSGSHFKIDTNNNGQIEVSEALNVKELRVNSSSLTDLAGIANFTSLITLSCSTNQLTSLDVTALTGLQNLYANDNVLNSLNIAGLGNLITLECGQNQLSQINLFGLNSLISVNVIENQLTTLSLAGLTNLVSLECTRNQLTNVNLMPVPNLTVLRCEGNLLTSLDLAFVPNLNDLLCNNNQLTSLNLTPVSNLETLLCGNNQLTNLDVSFLTHLYWLDCRYNSLSSLLLCPTPSMEILECRNNLLTNINLSGLVNLDYLVVANNQITSLDLSNVPLLHTLGFNGNPIATINLSLVPNLDLLNCGSTQITTLDVTPVPNLTSLSCSSSLLTTLDVSSLHVLTTLYCKTSNNLTAIIMKNGSIETTLDFSGNPALQYICADDNQLATVQTKIATYGYTNCQANSYCSFVPGGTLYNITGNVRYDLDNNGCGVTDVNVPLKINMASGSVTGTVFTTASGSYSSPVNAGLHAMTPALEMPAYFTVSPTSASVNFPTTASPATRNFCIARNGNHNDLEVALIPINLARPGFDATYKIIYKNKGTAAQSGSVNLAFSDAVSDLISATPSVSNQSANNLSWSFANLQPFETRSVTVTLNLNSPTETPSLHGGDVLDYSATVASSLSEETAMDNVSQLHQSVVNAFDPNDKTCLEGNTISPDMVGNYVHYVIRFENTGTANAENIVVKDMIDITKFDIASLIPLTGSHSFTTRISANKVEFIFENINLPFDDANNDGYVAFKIKTKPTLVIGDTFSNTANIYFDYNFPILTNTATTAIQLLGTPDFEFSTYFTLYPNPANNVLNIQSKDSIQLKSAQIYNMLGQLVLAVTNLENASSIDVADLTAGNYFIKIHSDKGTAATKFIKQ
jgi:Leucine-rich repeat (LRR) protein